MQKLASFSKILLSGSTDGRAIRIASLAAPGTLIHQSQALTTGFDEIWLYGQNNSVNDVLVTILFGGNQPEDRITMTVPGQVGLYLIVPGLAINNSVQINAFASTLDVVSIFGFANRMVP